MQYEHFVEKIPKCMEGVSWKASAQNYYLMCIENIFKEYTDTTEKKEFIPVSGKEIPIYERGKERIITPIHIKDRMVQKVLCDFCLTPIIMPTLIYDNGASLKGKGVEFTRKRFFNHLKKALKEFGTDFYVLSFDFKSYFDSIPHSTCRKILKMYFSDDDIVDFTMQVIKSTHKTKIMKIKDEAEKAKQLEKLNNDELCGICLGSQVSQIMALVVANQLDHYIKDVKRIKYYIRYMDDGRIFAKTKEELKELFNELKEICDDLGLKFNTKKTQIIKASKGFVFLKVKYYITKTKGVVRKLDRRGVVRMRRKLKKFKRKVDDGDMALMDVYASMQSWLAHSKVANSYKTVNSMMKLYNKLFDGYLIKNKEETKRALQIERRKKYSWSNYQYRLQEIAKTS